MTLEELAELTGASVEDLRRWHELDLLVADDASFAPEEVERARLIRFALHRGVTPERLAEISAAHGDIIGSFVEQLGSGAGEPVCTMDEAVARVGIDPEIFERAAAAAGLRDRRYAYPDDLEAIRTMQIALEAGLPAAVLVQLLRVFADATTKIADASSRLFHLYVHEQLRAGGASGGELLRATNAIAAPLLGLVEPAVLYFHRKAWERALAEDMMLHLFEEMTAPAEVPGEFQRAIVFVDLSAFTPMTEAMGDDAAAEVLERFSELVREVTAQCAGQVVKQIGDEFMLVFPDGHSAVTCGLGLRERAAIETRFPALRLGAHVGSVLYREGDYVGTTVNTAARVAAFAARDQFLVTEPVRSQIDSPDVEVIALGPTSLKGLSDEIEVFEIRSTIEHGAKVADPVCGMQIDDESAEARLNWQGRRLLFCSEGCLRRFVDQPERYVLSVE